MFDHLSTFYWHTHHVEIVSKWCCIQDEALTTAQPKVVKFGKAEHDTRESVQRVTNQADELDAAVAALRGLIARLCPGDENEP